MDPNTWEVIDQCINQGFKTRAIRLFRLEMNVSYAVAEAAINERIQSLKNTDAVRTASGQKG